MIFPFFPNLGPFWFYFQKWTKIGIKIEKINLLNCAFNPLVLPNGATQNRKTEFGFNRPITNNKCTNALIKSDFMRTIIQRNFNYLTNLPASRPVFSTFMSSKIQICIIHSSKISGLCLKKWPSERIQNLPYFAIVDIDQCTFIRGKNNVLSTKWKKRHILKIWQIKKHFARSFHQA